MSNITQRITKAIEATGLTRSDLARKLKITPQSIAGWERTGTIGTRNLLALAALAKMDIEDILGTGDGKAIRAYDIKTDEDPPEEGEERVDVLEIEVSAGDGLGAPEFVATKYKQTYRREFLRSCGVRDPDRVKIASVHGRSMERLLFHGDKVLFHLDDTRVQDDRMYVVLIVDQLRVKYLRRRRDGGLIIISENKEEWPPEEFGPEELNAIQILGRVIDKSGRGGLG